MWVWGDIMQLFMDVVCGIFMFFMTFCMQIFIFPRALVVFLMIFFAPLFFYRGTCGRVATHRAVRMSTDDRRVSCGGSMTGGHRTAFKSSLMESGMDMASGMIVLVM